VSSWGIKYDKEAYISKAFISAKETVSFKITSDYLATGLQGGKQHVDYLILTCTSKDIALGDGKLNITGERYSIALWKSKYHWGRWHDWPDVEAQLCLVWCSTELLCYNCSLFYSSKLWLQQITILHWGSNNKLFVQHLPACWTFSYAHDMYNYVWLHIAVCIKIWRKFKVFKEYKQAWNHDKDSL